MKTVSYTSEAAKALRKHSNVAARILKAIEAYATDESARANNVTLLVGSDAKRLRVGDFRVVFSEDEASILVTKIGPRGGVYD